MQGEVCMEWNKEVTERVRGAMRDRARVMACLCGELEKILLSDKAEAAARKAITSYGCIRAERDGHKITPDEWVDIHYRDMGGVFETEITKNDEYSEMRMHYCPLLEEWKAMGLSPEKQDLYCDIAMELDRSRARHTVRYRRAARQGRQLLPRPLVEKSPALICHEPGPPSGGPGRKRA